MHLQWKMCMSLGSYLTHFSTLQTSTGCFSPPEFPALSKCQELGIFGSASPSHLSLPSRPIPCCFPSPSSFLEKPGLHQQHNLRFNKSKQPAKPCSPVSGVITPSKMGKHFVLHDAAINSSCQPENLQFVHGQAQKKKKIKQQKDEQ